MADVLLAMRPEWLELILSERKTAEFRRVMPKQLQCDDWLYLYCKGYIHGRVRVQNYDRADMYNDLDDGCRALARYYYRQGCLTWDEAYNYLRGGKSPGVIHLAEVQINEYPVRWEGVGHPQNFIYLKGAEMTEAVLNPPRQNAKTVFMLKNVAGTTTYAPFGTMTGDMGTRKLACTSNDSVQTKCTEYSKKLIPKH